MQSERSLVRSLLTVLLLTLIVVYTAVVYHREYNKASEETEQMTSNPWITINVKQKEEEGNKINTIAPSQSIKQLTLKTEETWEETVNTDQNNETIPITTIDNTPTNNTEPSKSTIKVLPSTSIYIWWLASLQKLGLIYDYILKDDKGIYYVRLAQNQDLAALARSYNGNTVEIVSDADLQKNQLFGDMVTFINIPQYANNIVLMVVDIKEEKRLIQIDYTMYHENKQYIKERFN